MHTLFRPFMLLLLTAGSLGPAAAAERSLYDRMGGNATVTAVVDELIDHTASDPRTSRSWAKVKLPRVKIVFVEYLCALTGGPCTYTGDSIKDIHAGMGVNESELYAVVENLRDILIRHGVGLRERNELLALLAPTKKDVVQR